MKILYHHRVGSRDGQAVHLDELVEAMREIGHEVVVVGPRGFARAKFGHDPGILGRAKQLVPKGIYEIAELCHNLLAFPRLLFAYANLRPDFVYERYNLYSLAGILLKRSVGAPLILEVNAPLARERAGFGGLGLPRLASVLERWVWRSADIALPVTDVLAADVLKAGARPERVTVICNAIDPERFGPHSSGDGIRREFGLTNRLVLGFTGFVRPWHGLELVVDLLKRSDVPEHVHLLIAGDGPALPELKIRSRALGVADRVTFAGLVGRDRIADVVGAFDIALLPKCVDYCSPLKLFEYMAAGKAIVAPDQRNIREVLVPGVSGMLFEPENSDTMAEAVLRLVHDRALRTSLGREARAKVFAQRYTWRANAERVCAIAASLRQQNLEQVPQTAH